MSRNIETNLIEKALAGDELAFSQIYFALRDSIYGFAFRMLHDKSLAEDITQETFIFLVEHPEKYRSERGGSLLSFLCGFSRNRIMHYLRKQGIKLETSYSADEYHEIEDKVERSPLKLLLGEELSAKIEEGINKLPALQREVIILRAIKEFSYEEIAQIIEADTTVVKMRLYRGRKNLLNHLSPYLVLEKEKKYDLQRN